MVRPYINRRRSHAKIRGGAMRVFVTGATGYVGFAVATALRRAGHDVYGLTRAAAKVPQLARQEIRAVIGDIGDPKSYADMAESCSVLVHAAFESSASAVTKDKTAVDALIEAGGRGAQPKTLIYTSGVWVHGDTGGKLVDETDPPKPIKLVAWRPAHEQLVLQAKAVRGLVIRPGCVYGGRGGLTGGWFEAAAAGKAPTVVGSGHNRWTMVHVDDLADAYVPAAPRRLRGRGGPLLRLVESVARVALFQQHVVRPTRAGRELIEVHHELVVLGHAARPDVQEPYAERHLAVQVREQRIAHVQPPAVGRELHHVRLLQLDLAHELGVQRIGDVVLLHGVAREQRHVQQAIVVRDAHVRWRGARRQLNHAGEGAVPG